MMSKRILFSILLLFAALFVLFMFSALSSGILTQPQTNSRDGGTEAAGSVWTQDALLAIGADALGGDNPLAVLISSSEDELAVFAEWCGYGKYRFSVYPDWPETAALNGAAVVLAGRMEYTGETLAKLLSYAQTGVPLVFTRLPDYETLAADPALADFFGIARCVDPAVRVDGLKLFADFFLSKERIYAAGDFYGEADDTEFTLPYYTLRAGYEGYMVGLLNDQLALGIENEQLPTLLWRAYTGRSQVCAVNTDLFDGERMLGVLTAFVSAVSEWHLYPVVNARTILLTGFPFLSNENSQTMQRLYSRDTLGFQRDIVWPNVVKVLRNYEAVPNFFLSPQLDYADGERPLADDLSMYLRQIQGLSGTAGLSLAQTSGLSLRDVAKKAADFFQAALPDFRFYAAYGGSFTDAQWRDYLASAADEPLEDLSLILFPYREGRALFTLLGDRALSALMTTNGFAHETLDDLQLISLMTALGYSAQQVDMERALLPAGDEDDWSNLSELWSKGDTYYRDFAKFESASVYELEARARALLTVNFTCAREGDTLRVSAGAFDAALWFVLRLHGETVTAVSGGKAVQLSGGAWLIRMDGQDAAITLARTDYLLPPGQKEGEPS